MLCNDCRNLILDHLYGLLDPAEALVVETHLAACPACTAARAEAAKVQGLIATAAKGAFPEVRFESPAAKPRMPAAKSPAPSAAAPARNPVVIPFPEPSARGAAQTTWKQASSDGGKSRRVGSFLPWAVAAAVMLAIPGTVIPVRGIVDRAETARKDAAEATAKATTSLRDFEAVGQDAERARDDARRNLTIAKQNRDSILEKWVAAEKAVAEKQESRKVDWTVFKPTTIQPGAPNDFLLVVRDVGKSPNANPRVLAEVRDQTDAVVYSQSIDYEKRRDPSHVLRLPARVWEKLTPQSELFLVVSEVDSKTGKPTEIQDKVRLLGPVFATVLTTDKPTYRPGESVYFRSLTLDRVTFAPPAREQMFRYTLLGPNGHPINAGVISGGTELARVEGSKVKPVLGPDGKLLRGVGSGAFLLPTNAAEGDYTLVLQELPHPAGYPPTVPFPITRTVKVRTGAADIYQKQFGYTAASYNAGDVVEAWAELKFQEKPVAGADVVAVATADGQQIVVAAQPTTNSEGKARLRFVLPQDLDRADVRLKVLFRTEAGEELAADRVPVVGGNIVVEFFPEGGTLIAGVPCRVYVRATTPAGQPVDVSGFVTDGRKVLAQIRTMTGESENGANRGLGSFTYTPELGRPIWLKFTGETGKFPATSAAVIGGSAVVVARAGHALPEPDREGVVMTVPDTVTAPGEPIRVHLRSVAQTRNLVVGAYTRGRLSDTKRITAEAGEVAEVRLMANSDPRGGVVRITVFEEPEEVAGKPKPDLKPVAERLVFRKPGETLKLDFATTGTKLAVRTDAGVKGIQSAPAAGLVAGSTVDLNITATDEKGNPKAAVLYAAVVNAGVAPGARDRLLPTHFLLAGELSTPDAMEYADFLLTDHPKAPEALDLVLATQGWRRFAEQTVAGFTRRPGPPVDRPGGGLGGTGGGFGGGMRAGGVAQTADYANLVACNGQYATWTEPQWSRDRQKMHETFWPAYEASAKSLEAAKEAVETAEADRSGEEAARRLAPSVLAARDEAQAAAERAELAAAPVERFRGAGWFAVAAFGVLALMLGVACFAHSAGRLPLGIGTLGSLGLVGFLVFTLLSIDTTNASERSIEQVARLQVPALPPISPEAPNPRQTGVVAVGVDDVNHTGAKDTTPEIVPGKGGVVTSGGGPGVGGTVTDGGGTGGKAGPTLPLAPSGGEKFDPKKPGDPYTMPPPSTSGPSLPSAPTFVSPVYPPPPGGFPVPKSLPKGSGWQKNGELKLVPDDLLEEARTARMLFRDGRMKKTDRSRVGEGATQADAKPAADKTAERTDAHSYYLAQEAAKQRSETLRKELETWFDRQPDLVKGQEGSLQLGPGAGTVVGKFAFGQAPDVLARQRVQAAVPVVTPLVVREYAAPRPGSLVPVDAPNEADTILWQPVIVLPSDGKATLNFTLGNAPGGYQVIVAGHTLDGRLGAVRGVIPVAPSEQAGLAGESEIAPPITPGAQPAPPAPVKP